MAKESIKCTSVCSFDLLQNRILFWLKTVAWHFKLDKCVRLRAETPFGVNFIRELRCYYQFPYLGALSSWILAGTFCPILFINRGHMTVINVFLCPIRKFFNKSHQNITSVLLTEPITHVISNNLEKSSQAPPLVSEHTQACNWNSIARQLIKNWLELG